MGPTPRTVVPTPTSPLAVASPPPPTCHSSAGGNLAPAPAPQSPNHVGAKNLSPLPMQPTTPPAYPLHPAPPSSVHPEHVEGNEMGPTPPSRRPHANPTPNRRVSPAPNLSFQRRRESRAGPGTPVTQPCRGAKSFAPHPRPQPRHLPIPYTPPPNPPFTLSMLKESQIPPPRAVVPTPTSPLAVASPPAPNLSFQRRRESRAGPGTPVTQPCRGEKSFAPTDAPNHATCLSPTPRPPILRSP